MANVHEEIGRSGTSGMWRCNGIGISQQVLPLQQRSPEDFLVLKQNSILSALVSMGSPPASLSSYFRPCRPRSIASGSRVSAYSRISRLQLTNRFPIHSYQPTQNLNVCSYLHVLHLSQLKVYFIISFRVASLQKKGQVNAALEERIHIHGMANCYFYIYILRLQDQDYASVRVEYKLGNIILTAQVSIIIISVDCLFQGCTTNYFLLFSCSERVYD